MTDWCMIDKNATGEVAQWLRSQPHMPGVDHDGANIVYTQLPPTDMLTEANSYRLPADLADDTARIKAIGAFLSNETERLLIVPRNVLERLYRTPEWRLWCANYSDTAQFEADKQAVGLDASLTQEQARDAIKAWVNS